MFKVMSNLIFFHYKFAHLCTHQDIAKIIFKKTYGNVFKMVHNKLTQTNPKQTQQITH